MKKKVRRLIIILIASFGNAPAAPTMPNSEGLSYIVKIDNIRDITISSGILKKENERIYCELNIKTKLDANKVTKLEKITVSIDGKIFAIPLEMLSTNCIVVETTPLFKIDDEHLGLVVKCGEGEYAFKRLFRISLIRYALKYEDWDLADNLEKNSKLKPLEKCNSATGSATAKKSVPNNRH